MRWTRAAFLTRTRALRTAKSYGPDAPTLASSRRMMFRRRRRQESPVSGQSTKETVKTIRAGNAGRLRRPGVTTLVCFLVSHARLRARAVRPAFPAPFDSLRATSGKTRVRFMPRECGGVSKRRCVGRRRRSNPVFVIPGRDEVASPETILTIGAMDSGLSLREPRNDGVNGSWIASRSLSSGAHSRDKLARNDGVDIPQPVGSR
jgi:hypothetical protein